MLKDKIENFAIIPFAYAATSQEGWSVPEVPGLPDRPVASILLTFIDWAIMMIGVLAIIIFIYGGFIYLTAQGETQKIEQAKKIILYAVVGIAVAVLGLVAVRTVDSIMKGNASPQGAGPSSPSDTPAPPSSGSGGPYAAPVTPPTSDVPTTLPSGPMR